VRWDTINTTQRIAESHLPAFLEHQGLGHGVHDPDMHSSVRQQKALCQAAHNFSATHGVDVPYLCQSPSSCTFPRAFEKPAGTTLVINPFRSSGDGGWYTSNISEESCGQHTKARLHQRDTPE
jgi:hypothetical protein